MKKIILTISMLLISLMFIGCNQKQVTTSNLQIGEIELNNQEQGIDISFTANGSLPENIVKYGVIYRFGRITKSYDMVIKENANNLFTVECTSDEFNNQGLFTLTEGVLNNLTNYVSLRLYYLIEEVNENNMKSEKAVYAKEVKIISLMSLVKNELSDFDKKILEANKVIYEVSILLDTTNYTVVGNDNEKYTAVIKKPLDYIKITILISCNGNYSFYNDLIFICNNKEVTGFKINEEMQLTYIIDDPNWTKIY